MGVLYRMVGVSGGKTRNLVVKTGGKENEPEQNQIIFGVLSTFRAYALNVEVSALDGKAIQC